MASEVNKPHSQVPQCSKCATERQRCDDCRWKCKCAAKCYSRRSWKHHCQKNKLIDTAKTKATTARHTKLTGDEYYKNIISSKCCKLLCLQNWTFKELKEFVSLLIVSLTICMN